MDCIANGRFGNNGFQHAESLDRTKGERSGKNREIPRHDSRISRRRTKRRILSKIYQSESRIAEFVAELLKCGCDCTKNCDINKNGRRQCKNQCSDLSHHFFSSNLLYKNKIPNAAPQRIIAIGLTFVLSKRINAAA